MVDASTVLAALVSVDSHEWAVTQLSKLEVIAAPHILHAEVANKLRRFAREGLISEQLAASAHAEMLAPPVELISYGSVADRVWELRHDVSAYDAWYVAVAELLDVPLVTLDSRLTRATGPRCAFISPD